MSIPALPSASAQAVAALPVQIAPTNLNIRYTGRFDTQDPNGPRCSWSASEVRLRFQGTALNARIKEAGEDRLQVVVDGKPTSTIELKNGEGVYNAASNLPPGQHTLALVKRTEAFVGIPQFLGFQMEQGGRLLPLPARPDRRIEVIGDSISCGFGNEGKNQNERFSPATENAYLTYGAIAARTLGAEYFCEAWSGRKMWPDNTMPEIYDRTLATDANSHWNAAQWTPDVVVINLATNDFGKDNPDEAKWTQGYEAFVSRLRAAYPKTQIYCAIGSMMSDAYPSGHKALTTLRGCLNKIVEDEKKAGDMRVHIIEFAVQDAKDGYGAAWHPNIKTHEIMAAMLVKTLEKDLGWTAQ